MNKYELAKKIMQLEGLTNEEKASLVELLRSQKKYGLVWEDKPEEIETRLMDELPVLTEVPERAIVSESPDAPNHILIEGDNLEALTALAYTHEGKIDVIYIDPPYNRGEKDFKYNDNYIDKDNPFKHSLWLSFMRKRLQIAKLLLSDRGVMIVHIDEHEFDALNLLLETEIFSSNNCLGQIIWNKLNPKGDANGVAVQHEYILIYCKNKELFKETPNHLMREKPNALKIIAKAKSLFSKIGKTEIPEDVKNVIKPFDYPEEVLKDFYVKYDLQLINKEFEAWLKRNDFSEGEKAYKYIDNQGNAFQPVSMAWPNKTTPNSDYFVPLIHPINQKKCPIPEKGWRFPSKTFKKMLGTNDPVEILPNMVIKGQVVFTIDKKGNNNQPRNKYLLKDNIMENTPSIVNDGSSNDKLFADLGIKFEYPKTLVIAKYLLKNVLQEANVILDFFAGSGTTLHATMQLNAEDGGHRKCILVTNNENNICEEVTYERNKRVIQGYTTPKGENVEGLHDNNLRYYRTTLLSRDKSVKNMRQLVRLATDMLCIKNDVYTEAPFCGKNINPNIARYFDNRQGCRMLVIYEERAIQLLVQLMAQTEDDGIKTMVYVFSPGADPYTDDFEDVAERVKLCALPSAIYEAYKRVLPKRKPKFLDEALQEMKTQAETEANVQQTLDFGENDYMNEEGGDA